MIRALRDYFHLAVITVIVAVCFLITTSPQSVSAIESGCNLENNEPICNRCSEGVHCLYHGTDLGVCTAVPSVIEDRTIMIGVTVGAGDKVCLPTGTSAANLCVIRSEDNNCGHCDLGATCYMDGRAVGTCTTQGDDHICPPGSAPTAAPTATGVGPGAAPTPPPPAEVQPPHLTVDIPGLPDFSEPRIRQGSDGYRIIDIPWLSDYIAALYVYLVYFGSIIAIVMIMVGGLQWLTAADSNRATSARQRISNALVGLALLLSSYLILHTINSNLTELTPLRIKVVDADQYNPSRVLSSTTADTGTHDPSSQ